MPHALLIAPAGHQVGLATVCLGLLRACDRQGLRVAFVKPIRQHRDDRSTALVRMGTRLTPPDPIDRQIVDNLLSAGDDQTLMEHVVAIYNTAAKNADIVIIEGMAPEAGMVYATRINILMLKALDAELVLVAVPHQQTPDQIADAITIAARGYGNVLEGRRITCVLNRVAHNKTPIASTSPLAISTALTVDDQTEPDKKNKQQIAIIDAYRHALDTEHIRPVGIIPFRQDLAAPRVKDLAHLLEARVIRAGDYHHRRIHNVSLCAMTVPNALRAFNPGTLIITPADRHDIIMAASLAVQGGLPLAGLLLTGGIEPDPQILALCDHSLSIGLPVLSVTDDSFSAALRVSSMNWDIPLDDHERVELVMNAVADCFDASWISGLTTSHHETRLSPPAFRYRLIETARAVRKRIVLPEGAEPRTIAAAIIAHERGIAHCVLLGNPDDIRASAKKQGLIIPPGIDIIDAVKVAPRYVAPLVERRKHKGMTVDIAASELEDTIMIGTMMMALGEADGLVSGAIHTTAHTIRPALQIIKMAPGCQLVSSIFFMCLPDQVLVFGDCAVNPDPNAEQLADIAIQSADSAIAFGIPARVAMLSYSTGISGGGVDVEKVKKATELAKARRPDLLIDGPLQYDAAIMPDVAQLKAPDSSVAGKATVLIFPDLNTGNVTYKAVQRSAHVVSMGPMLQGLAKPVNDLSRGCLIEDIVFTIALTAIQAQQTVPHRS